MELDASQKRKGYLALGVLGLLFVAVLLVFTLVDDGEGGGSGAGDRRPTASAEPGDEAGAPPGSGPGAGDDPGAGGETGDLPDPRPVVPLAQVAKAHQVMADYMAGVSTYDHASVLNTWRRPLAKLIANEPSIRDETALPTGKEWDLCKAERCSSRARATVVRDALVSDDLTRGSGQQISTVVQLRTTRTAKGETSTETNLWLVTAENPGGSDWKVSGFSLFGLGDAGASDQAG
ncbi:hypothetical protein [Streptomyces sp. NPDC057702]|uniref:hypothetical protein n=1 Tax=unclassified Streptomyces TaxID=2593676 RepID=UPI0036CAB93E